MSAHRRFRYWPPLAAWLLIASIPGWAATTASLDRELQALKAEAVALEKERLQTLGQTLSADVEQRMLVIFAAPSDPTIDDLTLSGPDWQEITRNATGDRNSDLAVVLSGMASPGRYELTATLTAGVSDYHCRIPLAIMPGAGAQYFELSASIEGTEPNCILSEWQ